MRALVIGLLAQGLTAHAASDAPSWGPFIPAGVTALEFNFSQGRVASAFDVDQNLQSFSSRLSGVPLDPFGLAGDQTRVDLSFETNFIELTAGFGLTDDLAAGVRLPFGKSCSSARLDTRGGRGPLLAAALTAPTGTFQYRDVDSHCVTGLMAPVVGAFWRIHKSTEDSLYFIPGFRLGRATDQSDPDVLFEPILHDGADAILLRADYFRRLGQRLDLAVQFERAISLRDNQTLRVPQLPTVVSPAAFKERLGRNTGDYTLFDLEIGYLFAAGEARVFAAWYQKIKSEDRFDSPSGLSTRYLEQNSSFKDQEYRLGFSWNGIPAWQRGTLLLPLQFEVNFWESFRGRNALKYYFNEARITLAF